MTMRCSTSTAHFGAFFSSPYDRTHSPLTVCQGYSHIRGNLRKHDGGNIDSATLPPWLRIRLGQLLRVQAAFLDSQRSSKFHPYFMLLSRFHPFSNDMHSAMLSGSVSSPE
jgi:hypothetical protein